ncbi:CDP-diacylglycerol--serine O-phosphatidyltransferase [Aureimonas jatrophae]|uniref:CDP-diacylglycerol--serine O-phosphatidyltransferase n=2 Tax=Aureimonas jatrophae TaxID=1166073 RepID=A0A1H0G805_9HYPH|nr:CDP-diacylglycerol--serine O-phosphatidyltransferase [Aureimonas jatrophae]MBB3949456.1 CDP-diacylglycerol--serine O-phosphatidyltransferase [Aureimonas jatrophae]SDO02998.1 CDP-diacylglycerol---serine O-phosphatidyltransferase [Aureimonas jatrophae]
MAESAPSSSRMTFRQILPNLITILSICAGVTGIRFAFEGRFELAVGLVLGAAFLDGIDGRIARLVNGQSRFGAEMDSLADIVNFGVAPALLLYAYTLHDVGSIGWIAALLYISGCALRLARFNTMLDVPDRPAWHSQFFTGIPSPAGAALALFPMYLGFASNLYLPDITPAFAAVYLVVVGILMASRIPTFSGKTIGIPVRRDHAVGVVLAVVLYIGLLLSFFWETLTVSAIAYYAAIPLSVRSYRRLAGRSGGRTDGE